MRWRSTVLVQIFRGEKRPKQQRRILKTKRNEQLFRTFETVDAPCRKNGYFPNGAKRLSDEMFFAVINTGNTLHTGEYERRTIFGATIINGQSVLVVVPASIVVVGGGES